MENNKIEKNIYEDDELDLIELLGNISKSIIKNKKMVLGIFILLSFLTAVVALYTRSKDKYVSTIVKINTATNISYSMMQKNALNSVYIKNNLNKEMKYSDFSKLFKTEYIIPKPMKDKPEYKPEYLKIRMKTVGGIENSLDLLNDYCNSLNIIAFKEIDGKDKNLNLIDNKINNGIGKVNYWNYYKQLDKKQEELLKIIDNGSQNLQNNQSIKYVKLRSMLESFKMTELRELEVMLLSSQIGKNKEDLNNELAMLEKELKQLVIDRDNYKKMVENFDLKERDEVYSKGVEIKSDVDSQNIYYVKLVDSYEKAEKLYLNKEKEIKILKLYLNQNTVDSNITEKELNDKLLSVIKKYNDLANRVYKYSEGIEKQQYSNMFKEIVSPQVDNSSNWKKILILGNVLAIIVSLGSVFIKELIGKVKKIIGVVAIFILVSATGYSKESVVLSFDDVNIQQVQNPDGTIFNLKSDIETFLKTDLNKEDQIKIVPINDGVKISDIYSQLSDGRNVNENIADKYNVILEFKDSNKEKLLAKKIENEFMNYYNRKYVLQSNVDNLKLYSPDDRLRYDILQIENLKRVLKGKQEILLSEQTDDNNKKKQNELKAQKYNELLIKLNKLEEVDCKNINNYINITGIAYNNLGKNLNLYNELKKIDLEVLIDEQKFYTELIEQYKMGRKQVNVTKDGNIVLLNSSSNEKERQYLNLTNNLFTINAKVNMLSDDLEIVINPEKIPAENEKKEAVSMLEELEKKINNICMELFYYN